MGGVFLAGPLAQQKCQQMILSLEGIYTSKYVRTSPPLSAAFVPKVYEFLCQGPSHRGRIGAPWTSKGKLREDMPV